MHNYVTLFDSNYFARGLAMYESLYKQTKDFRLFVIAFDDECYDKLSELALKSVTVIPLSDFEDSELLKVKKMRNRGEYCWTSTPKSVLYVFNNYGVDECTYVDSDLFFWNDPSVLIEEMDKSDSVLIIEHRFPSYRDMTNESGKYCVQFMTFRNDEQGNRVLNYWKDCCLKECSVEICGDQKYLDDWCERFNGIHVLQNIGGGVGPWNVDRYRFKLINDKLVISEGCNEQEVVFYHFHYLSFFDKDVIRLTAGIYDISDEVIKDIYIPYLKTIEEICIKYSFGKNRSRYIYAQHFISDDLDNLRNDRNFYRYSQIIHAASY